MIVWLAQSMSIGCTLLWRSISGCLSPLRWSRRSADNAPNIAIYRDDRPTAVIELKIFDEVAPLPSVGTKLHKAKLLARFAPLQVLLAVMICPIVVSGSGPDRTTARCRRSAICMSVSASRRVMADGNGVLPALR